MWPINVVCLLAGATKMRPLAFFTLNITGTLVRIGLIVVIGDLLEDPIRDIVSFITRYQWYLTGITFTLVALSLVRQGFRGHGTVESVDDLQQELAAAEADLEIEAHGPRRAVSDAPPSEHPPTRKGSHPAWNRPAPTSTPSAT